MLGGCPSLRRWWASRGASVPCSSLRHSSAVEELGFVSSGELLFLCFSGRPWRRGEERVVGVVPVLLLVVVCFVVFALAGRGGEGSGRRSWRVCCWWSSAASGRRDDGWSGGDGAVAVFFQRLRFPSPAADGSAVFYKVEVRSRRRHEVRRLRRSLGAWGWQWVQLRFLPAAQGVLCMLQGPCCNFFSFLDFFVMFTEFLLYEIGSFQKKKSRAGIFVRVHVLHCNAAHPIVPCCLDALEFTNSSYIALP